MAGTSERVRVWAGWDRLRFGRLRAVLHRDHRPHVDVLVRLSFVVWRLSATVYFLSVFSFETFSLSHIAELRAPLALLYNH